MQNKFKTSPIKVSAFLQYLWLSQHRNTATPLRCSVETVSYYRKIIWKYDFIFPQWIWFGLYISRSGKRDCYAIWNAFWELCKRNNYLLHEYLNHKIESSWYCLTAHHYMQSAMGKCLAPITLWLQALTFFLSEVECHWNGFFFPFLCNCYFSNIDFHWAFDCRHYLTKCLSNTWKITLL